MKQTHNSSFTKLQNRIIIDILTYIEDWKTRVEFMKSTKRISYMQWPSWWNVILSKQDLARFQLGKMATRIHSNRVY